MPGGGRIPSRLVDILRSVRDPPAGPLPATEFPPIDDSPIHNSLTPHARRLPVHRTRPGADVCCGMTIYDPVPSATRDDGVPRRGAALAAPAADAVTCANITDIDDKIIRRAVERGITIRQLTDDDGRMHADIARWASSARPTSRAPPRYVPQMLSMIGLQEKGGFLGRQRRRELRSALVPSWQLSGKVAPTTCAASEHTSQWLTTAGRSARLRAGSPPSRKSQRQIPAPVRVPRQHVECVSDGAADAAGTGCRHP